MKPVIALVGRPNVGKSTLFNRLTKRRDALVADFPGLTRDRQYGNGVLGEREYIVVDTGGLNEKQQDQLDTLGAQQAQQAIEESDIVLFLVDARSGLSVDDHSIAERLRRYNKPLVLVVNKIDGLSETFATGDFFSLGLGEPIPIAASHGRGVTQMMNKVLAMLPESAAVEQSQQEGIKLALLGRPNVGKSTLINRMLGEERMIAFDQPGTTRDSVTAPLLRDGQQYTLIDTAGIRRRGKVKQSIEKFSVIKALQAITSAHVVLLLLDAREGITDQDLSLYSEIIEQGRALVVVVNKWDGLTAEQRQRIKAEIDRRLGQADFIATHFISALHGSGVGDLFDAVQRAYRSAMMDLATPRLTELLEAAITMHPLPLVRGRRIKLRYAHQGGKNPPRIIIHGNQVSRVPEDYQRYLVRYFQKQLKLYGTPVFIQFKSGDNPYQGRRNKLTPRQEYKRKRLLRHVKKK